MNIIIISDSHDNLVNIEKLNKYLKKNYAQIIIHCGDICNPETLEKLLNNFSGKIHTIFGNGDVDKDGFYKLEKKYPSIQFHGVFGKILIDKMKVGFCHFPQDAEKKVHQENNFDVIFYGHTHIPWEKKINKTLLINPGTLAGLFSKATFTKFDTSTKIRELILLERIQE